MCSLPVHYLICGRWWVPAVASPPLVDCLSAHSDCPRSAWSSAHTDTHTQHDISMQRNILTLSLSTHISSCFHTPYVSHSHMYEHTDVHEIIWKIFSLTQIFQYNTIFSLCFLLSLFHSLSLSLSLSHTQTHTPHQQHCLLSSRFICTLETNAHKSH